MSDEAVSRLLQSLRKQAEHELLLELLDMTVEEDLIPTMGQWDGGVDSNCLFDDDAQFNDLEVKVVRDEHTGEVANYREAIEETPDTASSVLSLSREINTDNVQFTGISGGIPFMPGQEKMAGKRIVPLLLNPHSTFFKLPPQPTEGRIRTTPDSLYRVDGIPKRFIQTRAQTTGDEMPPMQHTMDPQHAGNYIF
ncbi:Helicase SKI2W [Trichuris trichiura]|uniref:Helicase SKI2W n=1 Tax=Trichuris trichiura TaxID=36087 RepID=A0A077ZC05_TRITR|nr:Helicase SKI2W [Trichuris trichiura]